MCRGDGHTEALKVEYDPSQVTYVDLLDQFFKGHRPSGGKAQYKSAIWYHNEDQKKVAEDLMDAAGAASLHVDEAKDFHDAEDYHQKYMSKGCGVQ